VGVAEARELGVAEVLEKRIAKLKFFEQIKLPNSEGMCLSWTLLGIGL